MSCYRDYYHFDEAEAAAFADFLMPMLDLNPVKINFVAIGHVGK